MEEDPESYTINIKTLREGDFRLTVLRRTLVQDVKINVKDKTGVPETRQRLIYRGRVLQDGDLLSSYRVQPGHTVHMVSRPPPEQMPHAAPTAAAAGGGAGLSPPSLAAAAARATAPRLGGAAAASLWEGGGGDDGGRGGGGWEDD
ncbi:unnamed protein product, partial [Phaeothamnion confervicola]